MAGDGPSPSWSRRGGRAAVPTFLLISFAALALASIADEAPTIDEVQHLAAGYTYLRTGDFRFGPEHPPLTKMLAAAPLALLQLKPVTGIAGWQSNDRPTFDHDFFLHNWASPWRMLFFARLPMVAVGIVMGLIVFLWGCQLWGYWPGVFGLFLYAFCPNILAHTRLVTTDAGVACFTVLTLFTLWRYARSDRLLWAVACGLALGAALLSKYSAVVTAATIPFLLLVFPRLFETLLPPSEILLPPNETLLPHSAKGGIDRRVAAAAGGSRLIGLAVIFTLAAATITIGYASPLGLARYYHGLREVQAQWRPEARTKWSFLWGQYSRTGFWDYYLLAQLWKTPIPTLLFFVWGLVVIARERSRWFDAAFLLVPIAAFHGAGMLSEVNIGIRHLLPVLPFLFLVCAAAVANSLGWRRPRPRDRGAPRQRLMAMVVCTILSVWYVVGTLRTAPYFISYFNELIGGPDNGIHYLDDSNIDWGQDLFRVRRYIERHHLVDVRLASFAPLNPEEYGIEAQPIGLRDLVWPQAGVTYFVSADYLQRRSLYGENTAVRFDWLRRYRPVDKVGWSIFVYRFSTDPAAAGDLHALYLPRAQWYAEAIAALRTILAQSPEFAEARTLLAQIEAEKGSSD